MTNSKLWKKNSNCGEKTQTLKLWQKSKNQIVTQLENSNCDKTQIMTKLKNQMVTKLKKNQIVSGKKIVTKLKNSNCVKTQKLKLW